jgi:hypothetical protein
MWQLCRRSRTGNIKRVDIFATFVVGIGPVDVVTINGRRTVNIFAILVIIGRVDIFASFTVIGWVDFFAWFIVVRLVCVSSLFGIIGRVNGFAVFFFVGWVGISALFLVGRAGLFAVFRGIDVYALFSIWQIHVFSRFVVVEWIDVFAPFVIVGWVDVAEALSSPTASDGSVPLHHPPLEVSISGHHPSQAETPPDKEKFSTRTWWKNSKFFCGVAIIRGFIAKVR